MCGKSNFNDVLFSSYTFAHRLCGLSGLESVLVDEVAPSIGDMDTARLVT